MEVSLRHTSGTAAFVLAHGSWGVELTGEAAGQRLLQLDIHTESVGVWRTSMTALLHNQPPQRDLEHPIPSPLLPTCSFS